MSRMAHFWLLAKNFKFQKGAKREKLPAYWRELLILICTLDSVPHDLWGCHGSTSRSCIKQDAFHGRCVAQVVEVDES